LLQQQQQQQQQQPLLCDGKNAAWSHLNHYSRKSIIPFSYQNKWNQLKIFIARNVLEQIGISPNAADSSISFLARKNG